MATITITEATLTNKVTEYIKNVLNTNITGVDFWEGKIEKEAYNLPAVFFEIEISKEATTLTRKKVKAVPIIISFEVFAGSLKDRDETIDSIEAILSDNTKLDSNGDSIQSKYLSYRTSSFKTDSVYPPEYKRLIQHATGNVTLHYNGG